MAKAGEDADEQLDDALVDESPAAKAPQGAARGRKGVRRMSACLHCCLATSYGQF